MGPLGPSRAKGLLESALLGDDVVLLEDGRVDLEPRGMGLGHRVADVDEHDTGLGAQFHGHLILAAAGRWVDLGRAHRPSVVAEVPGKCRRARCDAGRNPPAPSADGESVTSTTAVTVSRPATAYGARSR